MPVGYPVGVCSNRSTENGGAAVAGSACGLHGIVADVVAAPGNKLAGYPEGVA